MYNLLPLLAYIHLKYLPKIQVFKESAYKFSLRSGNGVIFEITLGKMTYI